MNDNAYRYLYHYRTPVRRCQTIQNVIPIEIRNIRQYPSADTHDVCIFLCDLLQLYVLGWAMRVNYCYIFYVASS